MQELKQRTTTTQHPPPPLENPNDQTRRMNTQSNDEIEFQTQRIDHSPRSPTLWTQRMACKSPKPHLEAIADGRRKHMEMIQSRPESTLELNDQTRRMNTQSNNEIEFQTRRDHVPLSPTLWTKRMVSKSPNSRLEAIVDGRRQLMEMIQNRPESTLELSLKDIVLDAEEQVGNVNEVNNQAKDKGKTNLRKRGKITRSESLDSGVFLLKMFVPVSLYTNKKKSKPKSCSKISPNPSSFKEPEKPAETKDWWKIICLHVKANKYSRNIKRSFSSISIKPSNRRSTESRLVESSSLLDEFPFDSMQYTSRNQRGCLF